MRLIRFYDWLRIIKIMGDEGGVVYVTRLSRNTNYARRRIRELADRNVVEEVVYGKVSLYKLTEKGSIVAGFLKIVEKLLETECDESTLTWLEEVVEKINAVLEGGKVEELEVAAAPSTEVVARVELPSFAKGNPWLDVLFSRGKE